MFLLTSYERKVLLCIGILILAGSMLRFFNVSLKEPTPPLSTLSSSIVNINNAPQKELENIPGIGEKIAQRIIEYRRQYGGFKTFEDLKKVKGIGDKKLEVIKPYIRF